jgi:hypothetical protein
MEIRPHATKKDLFFGLLINECRSPRRAKLVLQPRPLLLRGDGAGP